MKDIGLLHSLNKAMPMKSDSQIKKDVLEELKWEPAVNASHIGVEVNEGVVTLVGRVANYAEKWHAEKASQRVGGVRAIAVEIDVVLPGITSRSDAEIAASIAQTLEWMTNLPAKAIQVGVENGWVTLSGVLDWDFQRRAATRGIRYLLGVTGVSNQITLKPGTVSPTTIKTSIESALARRAQHDASQIAVQVDGSAVTLSGFVADWSELNLAARCAWNTQGVHTLENNLVVT